MKKLAKKLSVVVMVLLWVLIGQIAKAADSTEDHRKVQVQQLDLHDETRQRPVKITIWYPAQAECDKATICLSEHTRLDQAAVISHGAMGSAMDYNWLGYAMASQGIVTVGINHFGESWIYGKKHIDPSAVLRFEQRPADVSFVLTQLALNYTAANNKTALFSATIDWNNITAIGHSSGGATAIALAGSQLAISKAKAYCASEVSSSDKSCAYMQQQSPDINANAEIGFSFRDARIKRVIALDPALGHATTEKSLDHINIPVLVIGSRQNDFLNFDHHAGFYGEHIPQAKSLVLDKGEGHFIYLDSCDRPYKAMGVPLCTDRQGVNRELVQKNLYPHIFRFIFSS